MMTSGFILPPILMYTLNEVESTCRKALRGAGYSWGPAEECAKANKWMIADGIGCLTSLCNLMDEFSTQSDQFIKPDIKLSGWGNPTERHCPIITGCGFLDLGYSRDFPKVFYGISHPLQFAAVAGIAARFTGKILRFTWPKAVFFSEEKYHASGSGIYAHFVESVEVFLQENLNIPADVKAPTENFASRDRLERYAFKNYVPATEKSGSEAGSASSDND